NLPARLKMTPPNYVGLQKEQVPEFETEGEKVKIQPVSGTWSGHTGPVQALTGIEIARLSFQAGASYSISIPAARNILFYVINGRLTVNGQEAATHNLVTFENQGESL